jgi:hypothetical protein
MTMTARLGELMLGRLGNKGLEIVDVARIFFGGVEIPNCSLGGDYNLQVARLCAVGLVVMVAVVAAKLLLLLRVGFRRVQRCGRAVGGHRG